MNMIWDLLTYMVSVYELVLRRVLSVSIVQSVSLLIKESVFYNKFKHRIIDKKQIYRTQMNFPSSQNR